MNWQENSGKKYSVSVLTLIAILFVWLAPLFWKEVEISRGTIAESFENSELYQYVYPILEYSYGRLREGEIPLWNPYQLCGTPLNSDPRIGLFQPLNVVFLFMPVPQGMAVHSFLCLILMGVGFTLFLRSLRLGYNAAFFGGIAYAFSGAAAAAMSRPSSAAALAWTPFCLWATRLFVESGSRRTAVLLGVFLALCALSGAFSWFLMVAVLVIVHVMVESHSLFTDPSKRRVLLGLGLSFFIGLSLSAVQWLPSFAAARSWAYPESWFWAMPIDAQTPISPKTLGAQLFMCKPGALPRIGYLGMATLLLAPAAAFHWTRRKESLTLFGIGSVSMLLYFFWWKDMPLGLPSHILVYSSMLALAGLAGVGLDRLLIKPRLHRVPVVWHAGILIFLLAAVLFYAGAAQIRGYTLALIAILFPALVIRVAPVRVVSGVLLAAFLFVDLTVASVNAYRHPFTEAPGCFERARETFDMARRLVDQRRILLSARELDANLPENAGMLFRVPTIGGAYLPFTLEEEIWWGHLTDSKKPLLQTSGKGVRDDTPYSRLIDCMATGIIVASPDSPLYEGVWQKDEIQKLTLEKAAGTIRLWRNESALPRVYWVASWRIASTTEEVIATLMRDDFDPQTECLLDSPPNFSASAPVLPEKSNNALPIEQNPAPQWTCAMVQDDPEHVVVACETPFEGILILADRIATGWIALLDGHQTPILRANGLFRAVAIPAGKHRVEFIYHPRSFVAGAGTSVAGIALAVFLALKKA